MSTAEIPSLLDDAAFLAELQNFDCLPPRVPEVPIPDERIATLDHPAVDAGQREAPQGQAEIDEAERRARLALARSLGGPPHEHGHKHARVPMFAAVLVFVLGALAGASAATWVFQDRVEQIVARWTR